MPSLEQGDSTILSFCLPLLTVPLSSTAMLRGMLSFKFLTLSVSGCSFSSFSMLIIPGILTRSSRLDSDILDYFLLLLVIYKK